MVTIAADIPGVVVCLNDIVVYGAKCALHDDHLSKVLDVLADQKHVEWGKVLGRTASTFEWRGLRPSVVKRNPTNSITGAAKMHNCKCSWG